jgi:hypothetical protein
MCLGNARNPYVTRDEVKEGKRQNQWPSGLMFYDGGSIEQVPVNNWLL